MYFIDIETGFNKCSYCGRNKIKPKFVFNSSVDATFKVCKNKKSSELFKYLSKSTMRTITIIIMMTTSMTLSLLISSMLIMPLTISAVFRFILIDFHQNYIYWNIIRKFSIQIEYVLKVEVHKEVKYL